MPGRHVAGALIIRPDCRDRDAGDVVDADRGERAIEHVAEGAVLLHLWRREEDAVDAALHHRRQRVLGARAFRLDAREQDAIALTPRLLLGTREQTAEP